MSDKNWDILFQELTKINGHFDAMDERLDKLESGQQRHEDLLQQLIHISANTNSRVIQLEEDVAEIKASQAMMLSIQQDQQKILERLSVRSISHEADIAELRRIK